MMNMVWNQEFTIKLVNIILAVGLSLFIMKKSWKQYGLLFLAAAVVGNILCLLFVNFGFYSYPVRFFPDLSPMPFTAITTVFPAYVLAGVYWSPRRWVYKIPFYWAFVHLGMFAETYVHHTTGLIQYDFAWDLWDSYTWWWIYLLFFEYAGGRIVAPENRRPIAIRSFFYGRWAWAVFHFIMVVTIFLGGYYLGKISP